MTHARRGAHSGQSRRQNTHDHLNNRLPSFLFHTSYLLSFISYL